MIVLPKFGSQPNTPTANNGKIVLPPLNNVTTKTTSQTSSQQSRSSSNSNSSVSPLSSFGADTSLKGPGQVKSYSVGKQGENLFEGKDYGASFKADPYSGKPLLQAEPNSGKSPTLLGDRTAPGFDPTVAQKIDPSMLQNGRLPQSASAALKKSLGGSTFTELDHIMPLELGGSNVSNFQLESGKDTSKPYQPGKNPTATDPLENQLASKVHKGDLSLVDAWKLMAQAKGYQLKESNISNTPSMGLKLSDFGPNGKITNSVFNELGGQWALHPIDSIKKMVNDAGKDANAVIGNLASSAAQFRSDVIDKTNRTGSEKVASTLNLLHSIASFTFFPVSETYSIASNLPVIKPAADAVGVVFDKAGKIVSFSADKLLDKLPLTAQDRETLRGPIESVASLVGQITLGGFVYGKLTDLMETKGGVPPEEVKVVAKEAEQHAESIAAESPKLLQQPESPKMLEAPKKQAVIEGEGFTMTDKTNKESIAKSKALSSYEKELEKYNTNPTEAQKNKVIKAKELKDELFAPVKEPISTEKLSPSKEITKTSEIPVNENSVSKQLPTGNVSSEVVSHRSRANTLKAIEGTGETKVRGLSEGVEAKAIQSKLIDTFGDLPEYKTVNIKEQAQRASELVNRDYESARAIALGEKSAPKGMVPESIYVAVENKAIAESDVQTLKDLANSKLATEATTMGQRIRTLAERDPESPTAKIKEIQEAREKAVSERAKKNVEEAKQDVVKQVKEHIKKASAKPRDWKSFVESITC